MYLEIRQEIRKPTIILYILTNYETETFCETVVVVFVK